MLYYSRGPDSHSAGGRPNCAISWVHHRSFRYDQSLGIKLPDEARLSNEKSRFHAPHQYPPIMTRLKRMRLLQPYSSCSPCPTWCASYGFPVVTHSLWALLAGAIHWSGKSSLSNVSRVKTPHRYLSPEALWLTKTLLSMRRVYPRTSTNYLRLKKSK
jgi:hypothetical protein